jgi:DNA-directed RNA polymerase subunit RPC12/RpoP
MENYTCGNCERQVPTSNRIMHEVRCTVSIRGEDMYKCSKCGLTLKAEEKDDHLVAHSLEEEHSSARVSEENRRDSEDYSRRDSSSFIRSQSLEDALAQIERSLQGQSSDELQRFLRSEHYEGDALTASGVEALPTLVFESSFHHELTDCMVCITQFEQSESLILLPCFHYFHAECIGPWLRQSAKCPSCRLKV